MSRYTLPHLLLTLVAGIALLLVGGCRGDVPTRPDTPIPAVTYVVVEGDTLTAISQMYGVDVQTITSTNGILDHAVHGGMILSIPGGHLVHAHTPQQPIVGPAPEPKDWFAPRSSWAVEPVILKRTKPMGGTPTRITVHHSGDARDAKMSAVEWLRLVDHQQMLGLGKAEPWACIGYHYIIAADGRVFEGRPLIYQGAHAGWDQVNQLNIGICLIGNFDQERVPRAQHQSLLRVLDLLRRKYHISRTQVFGHSHFKVTDCPGANALEIVRAYNQGTDDVQSGQPPAPVQDSESR